MNETQDHIFIDINCPQCGAPNKYEVYENIYSNVHLQAKQRLFNNTLFNYKCDHCKVTCEMLYEIVYYNIQHNTILYFVEQSRVSNVCAAIDYTDQDINRKWSSLVHSCKKRVVDNPMILREKSLMLEQDMDDRVVELVKVVCADIFTNADKRKPLHILFDRHNNDACLNVYYSNEMITTSFPQNLYDHFKHEFADILALNKDYVIDENWAADFMSKYK